MHTGSPWPVRVFVRPETATTGKAYHRRIGPAAAAQVATGLPSCSPLKILQLSQSFKGIWKVVAKEAQKHISARELFLSRQGHSQQADNVCAVSTTVPPLSQVIKDCSPDSLSRRRTGQSALICNPGVWTAEHTTAQSHSAYQHARIVSDG